MTRFFVPAVLIFTVSGLAFTLIAIIIARSPYTHGNLRPQGYNRTEIAYVGEEHPFEGLGLADPRLASTGDPVQDGRALFFQYGCASCHGLKGEGAVVGPDLGDITRSELKRKVRKGPKGMPAFAAETLSDEDLDNLYAFLESLAQEASQPAAGAIAPAPQPEEMGGPKS